jgi:magnesium chelatase family protein
MALAKAFSVSLLGLSGTIVEIEAEISSNLPSFVLVGLPDASLIEAKDRVRSAAHNSGLALPGRRVTVNLSPASVPKRGSSFDLAIAIAILAADGRLSGKSAGEWLHLGELGLDGSLRPVNGILPSVLAAKRNGWSKVIVPAPNGAEAALVEGLEVLGAKNLAQVARFHRAAIAAEEMQAFRSAPLESAANENSDLDLGDVVGQDEAVEALTIAAAGGHHLLMVGSPGVGKTMLAERLPTILPDLTPEQALETAAIKSIIGAADLARPFGLIVRPPFEAPHHSSSMSSLIGGGLSMPRPGMISLANHGVLFLDEAPEFQRPVLEALRQPLESGEVSISRTSGVARFPARFQLVLAANPCPCGNFAGRGRQCVCPTSSRIAYSAKLSGPLLDRIDIRLRLEPSSATQITMARLGAQQLGRSSVEIRAQVENARMRAKRRLQGTPWALNAQVPGSYLRRNLRPRAEVSRPLEAAVDKGHMSMRGYDRCLRIAWTCADLRGSASVEAQDLNHAILLRGSDGGW